MDIINLVKTFSSELYNYVKKGAPNVTEAEYKERLEMCASCEHLDKEKSKCKRCGCYMPVKAKWATADCPVNKWKKIEKK